MTPFEHDIIDLHIALEDWLGKGEGDSDALLARFSRFSDDPAGRFRSTITALPVFWKTARKPSGLKIVIDELTTIQRRTWRGASLPGDANPAGPARQRALVNRGAQSGRRQNNLASAARNAQP
jgi:hypothetical protein